jgi:Tol biopolymer transport system component
VPDQASRPASRYTRAQIQMSLEPDAQLGTYRVIAPLGAGGMGEVWRARDAKLDRDVALKVLPARLGADPDALARFEREAKAVAALSHPNILAIHDFGQSEGTHYAVMELLEGQTLREALAGAPLSAKKATEYGRQIAEGLAAAHDKGIVHRDLKPENVFVTHDGHVKILDFGLARQGVVAKAGADTSSPTVARGTEPGTVMGTAGYMAPEQVRGEVADHRADIFAFGAVLYEMLTGRRAFERATNAETMTAILREDPATVSSIREAVPPSLERVVEHCLEKRPEARFQSARDLAFDLGGSTSVSGRSAVVAQPGRRAWSVGAAAVGTLVLGLVGGVALQRYLTPPRVTSSALEVRYLTYSGHDFSPAASPDGRSVAFRSDRDGRGRIWVKQLATGTEAPLSDGPMDDLPQFAPDGATVLFTRQTGTRSALYRVPLLGGEPRRVIDDASDATWSPDGTRIAFLRLHPAAPGKIAAASLMVAASDGSAQREVTRVDGSGILAPRWSPDGRKISLTAIGVGAGVFSLRLVDVESGTIDTAATAGLVKRPWGALWTPSGHLVVTSGQITAGTLAGTTGRILSLDPRTGRSSVLYASPDSLGRLAPLGEGGFVVESQTVRQNVSEWLTPGSGRRLTQGRAADRQPVYSPDGKWIVFSSDRTGNLDLWAVSTATGEVRQLTDDAANDWDPAFGPDGRLFWSSNRSGHFEIWTAESDGSGARQVTHDDADAENPSASPDGQWIVYGSTRPGDGGVWRARPDGSDGRVLARGLYGIPEVSPDSRYVLYMGFDADLQRSGVHVVRLADGEPVDFEIAVDKVRSTTANMGRSHWMPDGRSIAFVGQDEKGLNGVFVQDFAPGRNTSSTRRKLAGFDPELEAETFGLSRDARRVALAGREIVSSLVLVEGVEGPGRAPR